MNVLQKAGIVLLCSVLGAFVVFIGLTGILRLVSLSL